MKISIDIPQIPKSQNDHWNGVLISFFNVVEEILQRKRKSSYLIHFFQEKLKKDERRKFLLILNKINLQLSKKEDKKQFHRIKGSTEEVEIPGEYLEKFHFFQRGVSELATVPHRDPKAGSTPSRDEEFSNIIAEEVIKCVKL
jgi:hypothetical protein